MIITISGLSGSGKSTLAKLLAKNLGYKHFDAGSAQRELAAEKSISLVELNKLEEKDASLDRLIDDKLLDFAKNNKDVVLEGRISGWMMHLNNIEAFKIWIKCPLETRIQRITGREKKDLEITEKETTFREKSENIRYKKYYNIDRNDLSIYDLIVNSKEHLPNELLGIILNKIKKIER